MLTIGSMFSGLLGGLDIACERVFDAETAWQLDIVGADVRRRHWPGVLQVEAGVRTVNPADLARVDVLCGGFPCQDLSTAGKGEGLDGARSGLYREMIRFAQVLRPQFVVFENVAPLLNVLDVLAADLRDVGYGLTYAVCEAADAGLPHLRRRVFVVAEAGTAGRGRVEVDGSRRWSAVESEREWVTPTERDHRSAGGLAHTKGGACLNDQAAQVQEWGTPRVGNSGVGGVRVDDRARVEDQVQVWPTPMQADGLRGSATMVRGNATLPGAVQPWATVTSRDYKTGDLPTRVGTEALSAQAGAQALGQYGRRLNPAWVEALMGVPQGWTLPTGPSLRDQLDAWRAPRGRYPATWDRSVPWPGFAWEPSRTLPDGPPCPGRPARIKGLGNGVVWQAAELGIGACVNGSASGQIDLFGRAAC